MNLSDVFKQVIFFFGAGATREAGCLTSTDMLKGLKQKIISISEEEKRLIYEEVYQFLFASLEYQNAIKDFSPKDVEYHPNIEEFVFILRKIINRDYLLPYPVVGNWSDKILKLELRRKDVFIEFLRFIEEQLKTEWLCNTNTNGTEKLLKPFKELLESDNNFKIDIFTINYDLVLEGYFNSEGVTNINTGFVSGQWQNNFFASDPGPALESKINYFKIHGSLDWERDEYGIINCNNRHEVVNCPAVIFGQENKMLSVSPFLELVYNFRERLFQSTLVVIVGYSFFDTYINNLILQAANESTEKRLLIVDPYLDPEPDKFVKKIKHIQNNDLNGDSQRYNITSISPAKISILKQTASEFFSSYLSNESSRLNNYLREAQEDEWEEGPFN
jgi:hypothetical protein